MGAKYTSSHPKGLREIFLWYIEIYASVAVVKTNRFELCLTIICTGVLIGLFTELLIHFDTNELSLHIYRGEIAAADLSSKTEYALFLTGTKCSHRFNFTHYEYRLTDSVAAFQKKINPRKARTRRALRVHVFVIAVSTTFKNTVRGKEKK